MKQIYKLFLTMLVMGVLVSNSNGQSFLSPAEGYNAVDVFPEFNTFSCYDIHENFLYANEGDTIRIFDMESGDELNAFGKPSGYPAWPSFLTASPDGTQIWAGFTNSGNVDDRIYMIDIATGTWNLMAHMSGNFDLEFRGDQILVSGLNSSDWSDPTSIFILDVSGNDNHQKVVEMGGSSAGLATDADGNVYYGTYFYFSPDPNAIYRWDATAVDDAIATNNYLTLPEGTKLSDLPEGAYDCCVDDGGNVFFNANSFSTDKKLVKWNGVEGDGYNYDVVATASGSMDWLTMIKTTGNLDYPGDENALYVLSWAQPIGKITLNNPPELITPIPNVSAYNSADDEVIDLNTFFIDADGDALTFNVEVNSKPTVASLSIVDGLMEIDFHNPGQTNVVVSANSNGASATAKFVVGVLPELMEADHVADFDNLPLADETYWNGSDLSGGFSTGNSYFPNYYEAAWGSWAGWSYSNTSDITTAGYLNQFSANTEAGFDPATSGGANYGVAYVPMNWSTGEMMYVTVNFEDDFQHYVDGVYVTNNTYATLSMKQGDAFAKKFGGDTGDDPDWFKLSVWGFNDGVETDTIDYYLADFRYDDNTKDYIIETWQWVDLSSLGRVDSLRYSVLSTDVGAYGMNTPAYFCMDNQCISDDIAPVVVNPIADITTSDLEQIVSIDLTNVFTDADDDDALIQKLLAGNTNGDVATASISGNTLQLDLLAVGTTTISIEGISNGKSVIDQFQVEVLVDNPPFVANAIEDIIAKETAPNQILDLTNLFSDEDNDDEAIEISVASNSNTEAVSATLSGKQLTLDFIEMGLATIVIEGVSNGLTVSDEFKVTVTDDLAPVVVNALADITVKEGTTPLTIDVTNLFNDLDDDNENINISIAYNTNSVVAGVTLSDYDLELEFLTVGVTEVRIEGESNGLVAWDLFKITVLEDQAPVVVNALNDIERKVTAGNAFIDISNVFTDADDNDEDIAYSITSNTNSTVVAAILDGDDLTLDFLSVGYSAIEITATSNGLTVADSFTVTVTDDEAPAVISPLEDIVVNMNAEDIFINLEDHFEDPDDAGIYFYINQNTNHNLVFASIDENTLKLTFTPDLYGEGDITIKAISGGQSVSDDMHITVLSPTGVDHADAAEIRVYPNPSNGQFYIEKAGATLLKITVMDAKAKEVYRNMAYESNELIDLQNLSAGTYHILINDGKSRSFKTIIIH